MVQKVKQTKKTATEPIGRADCQGLGCRYANLIKMIPETMMMIPAIFLGEWRSLKKLKPIIDAKTIETSRSATT